MRVCDCSTLSTCEVCCPPRTESELQEQINDLKSAYEAYRDRPSTNAPDQKPEDYARGYRIAVDPAASNAESESALIVYKLDEDGKAEIYSGLCLQLVHGRVHALLTGIKDRF